MLQRVIEALREAGAETVLVSCSHRDVARHAEELGAHVVAPADGPSGSVLSALRVTSRPLVVTTADHAFLRSEWVTGLVGGCADKADFALLFAKRAKVEARIPGRKRTYFRFSDGKWAGCNLFYLRTPEARAAIELWQSAERNRKKPWKLVARLGLRNLFDYLSLRLTAAEAVSRLGRRIGIAAAVVSAPDGMAAFDVDSPDDLDTMHALLDNPVGQPLLAT